MLGLPRDEHILALIRRYTHYCRNKKRITMEEAILYRQYHNDVSDISRLPLLLPVQSEEHYWIHYFMKQANTPVSLKCCKKSDKKLNSFQMRTKSAKEYKKVKPTPEKNGFIKHKVHLNFSLYLIGIESRIRHGCRSSTRSPTQRKLWKHHHSNWCQFEIGFCFPAIQFNRREQIKSLSPIAWPDMFVWLHKDNRKTLNFCFKSDTNLNPR